MLKTLAFMSKMNKNSLAVNENLGTFCFPKKVEKKSRIWYTFYNLGIKKRDYVFWAYLQ